MAKIVAVGDVHFGLNNGNKMLFEEQMGFFEKQLFPFIIAEKIKDVFFAGDLFDDRTKLDSYVLQEVKQRLFRWFNDHKVNANFIVGNHDLHFKNTRTHHHYKENLSEFKYCTYYDEPTLIKVGKYSFMMVPWLLDDEEMPDTSGADVVFGHFETVGFEMVKGSSCKKGLDASAFDSVKLTLSGHFHNIQNKTNKKGNIIQYLGGVLQINWNDFNEKKGFWTLGDNFDLTFHENEVSPKFLKFEYSDKELSVVGE